MVECPICISPTKVVGTYKKETGVRRTHYCKSCDHRFCTHQPYPEIVPFDPNYTGKLSASDKSEIRAGYKEGVTYLDLAVIYDVSESTIRDIVKGIRPTESPRHRLIATHSH